MVVQRASRNDLTELATETGTAPMQIAAVLRLECPVSATTVREVLARRLPGVPRLRQRLAPAPIGLGRPVWIDDPAFDLVRHVQEHRLGTPADEATVLRVAAQAAADPLPRRRPLWAVQLVTDATGACHAVVLVVHHVVADGIGGLAALSQLVDSAAVPAPGRFPAPAPTRRELLRDVLDVRVRALRSLPAAGRRLRSGLRELGLTQRDTGRPPRCSLNRPIGPRRRLAVARVALADAVAAAHRSGATVNDILLTAVAGALRDTLTARGEAVDRFVVSVPVSARRSAGTTELGNRVGVMPVTVPATGDPADRLAAIAGTTRTGRRSAGRGSSAALVSITFLALARLGLFSRLINRQRLVNTFVTNVPGPAEPFFFAGRRISDVIAVSPIAGNVTVAFAALSYAGTLAVTVIADPDACPDLDLVAAALQRQFDELTRLD
ncbi:MAG TPA: wax ester/triacylglycerol synthase domain-containing protein [Actinoplanes sp.]|nr:wax ester/triacylglycerol synthase domain-containing protein [Actinoplanes sp.]